MSESSRRILEVATPARSSTRAVAAVSCAILATICGCRTLLPELDVPKPVYNLSPTPPRVPDPEQGVTPSWKRVEEGVVEEANECQIKLFETQRPALNTARATVGLTIAGGVLAIAGGLTSTILGLTADQSKTGIKASTITTAGIAAGGGIIALVSNLVQGKKVTTWQSRRKLWDAGYGARRSDATRAAGAFVECQEAEPSTDLRSLPASAPAVATVETPKGPDKVADKPRVAAVLDGHICSDAVATPNLGNVRRPPDGHGCEGSSAKDTFCFKISQVPELLAQPGGRFTEYWFECEGEACQWNHGNKLSTPDKRFAVDGVVTKLQKSVTTGSNSVTVKVCASQAEVLATKCEFRLENEVGQDGVDGETEAGPTPLRRLRPCELPKGADLRVTVEGTLAPKCIFSPGEEGEHDECDDGGHSNLTVSFAKSKAQAKEPTAHVIVSGDFKAKSKGLTFRPGTPARMADLGHLPNGQFSAYAHGATCHFSGQQGTDKYIRQRPCVGALTITVEPIQP